MPQKNRVFSLLIVIVSLFFAQSSSAGPLEKPGMFSSLAAMLQPLRDPGRYVALTGFDDSYEESIKQAGITYFNSHPDLVERIRKDLDTPEVAWTLGPVSHRLLYMPETRMDVAGLFADYCRESIHDLLKRTGLSSPFRSILALDETQPDLAGEKGLHAYIVQDLAREYTVRYQFSGHEDKHIAIDLAGRMTVNEVGSYSSYLQYSEEKEAWEFSRDHYTVWKCASANPYTVLMTPLEETLHIALRPFTENAIITTIRKREGRLTVSEVQVLMENWLAVEEAIVGGLVYKLVPDVVFTRVPDLPPEWIEADLETKSRFHKYRFLPRGIDLVESHGLKEIIHLYASDPYAFRALLTEPG